jgi:hypothetical protein
MEDFSQSRGDDDLFDDEIIPLDPSEIETVIVQTQDPPRDPPSTLAPNDSPQRGYGPRGRGRGGRGRGNNELLNSKFAPRAQPQTTQTKPPPQQQQQSVPDTSQEGGTSTTKTETPTVDDTANPESNDTEPSPAPAPAPTPARTPAVRGDRTATGGIKKPKLTEDELTAKLAEAKERSQNLSAAHARAQADAASFEEREKIAQAKRTKDVANRKAMDTERAQNRLRKMAGMGGREWDSEKEIDEFRGRGRGGGYMRGAHGGVRYDRERRDPVLEGEDMDLRQYEWNEDRGRGRGGRGRGRGGYRGRGDARNDNANERRQPDVSAEAEFPALPERAKPKNDVKRPPRPAQARTTSDVLTNTDGKETWADQVESSEAAKQT